MLIQIPVSVGELFDKISILEIKNLNIKNPEQLKNIRIELDALLKIQKESFNSLPDKLEDLYAELKTANTDLWEVEDQLRFMEKNKQYNTYKDEFISLARDVYLLNDLRSRIKKEINIFVGSTIIEEKSYQEY